MKYRNIVLSCVSLLSLACVQADALTPYSNCGHGDIQKDVLEQVNAFRSVGRYCGLHYYPATSTLTWNQALEIASIVHSSDMADKNYFDHDSRNGDTFADRIRATGYTGTSIGENISAGRPTVTAAIQSWIKSPGHCANIMAKTFSELGVACAHDVDTKYKYFWTMDLGKNRI